VTEQNISSLSSEDRSFDPPADLAAAADVSADVYETAAADRPAFCGEQAKRLDWGTPFTEVLDWSDPPFAKWFVGGTLNAAYNCVDRHVESAGDGGTEVIQELRAHVGKEIGPIAKPRTIMVVPELPKTRSGKIMRRLLRDVAENREVGNTTTLADSGVMDLITSGMKSATDDD
jgi:acyl-CoA synthetase (AMP-forming)/AMP-acid ligase II